MSELAPPSVEVQDPGAHELAESSDDHFSDASEGKRSSGLSVPSSPIPITRVERVDDNPAHGEVPGTEAYKQRTQDAVPDEMEVVPEGTRSRSTSRLRQEDRPLTPGGTPVPKTIVEKVDPDTPSYGDVPGTAAYEMRTADATPDVVVKAPEETRKNLEGSPTMSHRSRSRSPEDREHTPGRPLSEDADSEQPAATATEPAVAENEEYDEFNDGELNEQNDQENGDDGFGDDFDDFEEGGGGDDDFGDFDDGFQEPEPISEPPQTDNVQLPPDPLASLPNLTFQDLQTPEDLLNSMGPYLSQIFPEVDPTTFTAPPSQLPAADPILTDRSASLWAQLVAPPPLQPPNWIRSRIRRLFLVSLGVPVDLDEILPASKQKKLVLPSIHLDSPRESSQISRLKKENASTTSVDSSGKPRSGSKERSRKGVPERPGPPPPPDFDANAASLLCSTTDIAMQGYSDEELRAHVERLDELVKRAGDVLEYWLKRKDSAVGDKEAFEGVIENLVGFVRSRKTKR